MARVPPSFPPSSEASKLESIGLHFASIADAAQEVAIFAYLDPEWRVLGVRRVTSRAVNTLTVPLRDVVADAIAFDAVAVAMAHNHPSGDPTPSPADYALTQRIARTLEAIGVRLIEHVVLARGRRDSFRARGLL